ncbi:HNH/ENDO VII family nuclease, partial [Dickeya dianthicola]
FRYYDPAGGCYVSPDPIGIAGGESNYGYVPNPVGWVDPFGLAGCSTTLNYWKNEPIQFKGNKVYQRDDLFDPNRMTTWRDKGKVFKGTNVERMATGRAPVGYDGKAVNLHHMLQSQKGPIAEMSQSFHKSNHGIIHINPNTIPSGIDRVEFNAWREEYWMNRASGYL